jgi:hypothetical protein
MVCLIASGHLSLLYSYKTYTRRFPVGVPMHRAKTISQVWALKEPQPLLTASAFFHSSSG